MISSCHLIGELVNSLSDISVDDNESVEGSRAHSVVTVTDLSRYERYCLLRTCPTDNHTIVLDENTQLFKTLW